MGSGKTHVARLLAKALKKRFIDLDTYIESKKNKTITEIFERHGERFFRNLESEALKDLSQKQNLIISTGGGTPCSERNQLLLSSGIVIYLDCNLRTLTDRLYHQKEQRPLIATIKTKGELYSFIRDMLKERKKWYQINTLKVKNNSSPKELIDRLLQFL